MVGLTSDSGHDFGGGGLLSAGHLQLTRVAVIRFGDSGVFRALEAKTHHVLPGLALFALDHAQISLDERGGRYLWSREGRNWR